MLGLDSEGFIYAVKPKMTPTKDARGNRGERQDGYEKTGAPLAKLILPESTRANFVRDLIFPHLVDISTTPHGSPGTTNPLR